MLPRILRLQPSTYQRLVRLSQEAERDGAYRVANIPDLTVARGLGPARAQIVDVIR